MKYQERHNLYANEDQKNMIEGLSSKWIIYPALFIAAGMAGLQLRAIVSMFEAVLK